MKLIKQKYPWYCLPTAFSMASDLSIKTIIDTIGHDGSAILFPDLPDPYCRKCFHIQEILDVAIKHNIVMMGIEAIPISGVDHKHKNYPFDDQKCRDRMNDYLDKNKGVLIGKHGTSMKRHAVAWNNDNIYDPNSTIYSIEQFIIESFWIVNNY